MHRPERRPQWLTATTWKPRTSTDLGWSVLRVAYHARIGGVRQCAQSKVASVPDIIAGWLTSLACGCAGPASWVDNNGCRILGANLVHIVRFVCPFIIG